MQQLPTVKLLFKDACCGFHGWCCACPFWVQCQPTLYAAYIHQESLLHHRFCLGVPIMILSVTKHKLCPWHIPKNKNHGACVEMILATPVVGECGSDNMGKQHATGTECLLPKCLAAAGVWGTVLVCLDVRFKSLFSQERRIAHKSLKLPECKRHSISKSYIDIWQI